MDKIRGMKRMREDGRMRGIGREEIIEDMEVDKERKGVKVKIPTLKGTYDPEVYLE